jgi:hypothetical protein
VIVGTAETVGVHVVAVVAAAVTSVTKAAGKRWSFWLHFLFSERNLRLAVRLPQVPFSFPRTTDRFSLRCLP